MSDGCDVTQALKIAKLEAKIERLTTVITAHEKIGELALTSAHLAEINSIAKWSALYEQSITERLLYKKENEHLKAELEKAITGELEAEYSHENRKLRAIIEMHERIGELVYQQIPTFTDAVTMAEFLFTVYPPVVARPELVKELMKGLFEKNTEISGLRAQLAKAIAAGYLPEEIAPVERDASGHINGAAPPARFGRLEVDVNELAKLAHYPACWDTACYESLMDALRVVCAAWECDNSQGMHPEKPAHEETRDEALEALVEKGFLTAIALVAANERITECEKGLKVYNDENQELVDVINEELRVKEPHSPKQLVRLAGERLAELEAHCTVSAPSCECDLRDRLATALALWDDEIHYMIRPDGDCIAENKRDALHLESFEKLLRGGGGDK